MKKSEIFTKVLGIVSVETEIPTDTILSDSKRSEVVDARYLLVYNLFKEGLRPLWIAQHIKKTARAVTFILSHFRDRLSHENIMRKEYDNIQKELRKGLL